MSCDPETGHHFSVVSDGGTCDCGEMTVAVTATNPTDEQNEGPTVHLGSIPQGQEALHVRAGYRSRFERAYKGEVTVVDWQHRPPESPKVRALNRILDSMPYVASEEARERASRRRALNRDEFALLNWWFYSGGTADELRRRVNGEDVPVHPDPEPAR